MVFSSTEREFSLRDFTSVGLRSSFLENAAGYGPQYHSALPVVIKAFLMLPYRLIVEIVPQ